MARFNDDAVKTDLTYKISETTYQQQIPYTRADAVVVVDGDIPLYLSEYLFKTDNGLGEKASIVSPEFKGIPTTPTPDKDVNTNSKQIANVEFVKNEISNLVDSAPPLLNTLDELANALGDDPNFATTVLNKISEKSTVTFDRKLDSGTEIGTINIDGANTIIYGPTGTPIVTTDESSTGDAYTATVPGIEELSVGAAFTMIPHVNSIRPDNSYTTLNVNGLGVKSIRRRISCNSTASVVMEDGFLVAGEPVNLLYNGSEWLVDIFKPDINDLYGLNDNKTIPVDKGGTSKNSFSENKLLIGNGINPIAELDPPTEDGYNFVLHQRKDGAPYWGVVKSVQYEFTQNGDTITLEGSDGSTTSANVVSVETLNNVIKNHTHKVSQITDIVISDTEPENPTTGMIWFRPKNNS